MLVQTTIYMKILEWQIRQDLLNFYPSIKVGESPIFALHILTINTFDYNGWMSSQNIEVPIFIVLATHTGKEESIATAYEN